MNFQFLDFIVIVVYLLLITSIGLLQIGKIDSYKSFFLANNNLPWQAIMFSIVATETSSLTFLSVPGMAYSSDLAFLQVALGYILGRIFVAYFILPLYYNGRYSSIYQWVGENFGIPSQKSLSAIFLISRVLADGVRLYVTSIPLTFILQSYFVDYSFSTLSIISLIIISSTTVLYTVIGGFRAVVITDSLQFFIYIFGGLFALFFLITQLGEATEIQSILFKHPSKLKIFHAWEGNFLQSAYFFPTAIFGGLLLSIGSHGVDQMFAQRLLACKNIRESRIALIGSGFLVFFQFLLFLLIGLLLFQFYNGENIQTDRVFSKYLIENIPSPILGLIVAAIFASAMSTLSSSINSLSLSVLVDWGEKLFQEQSLKYSKFLSVFWGVVLFFSSMLPHFLTDQLLDSLLELGLKITSFTLGPMIGIFLLGIFYVRKKIPFSSFVLIWALFLGIITLISFTYFFKPGFTLVIPFGIIFFYFYLLLFKMIENLNIIGKNEN